MTSNNDINEVKVALPQPCSAGLDELIGLHQWLMAKSHAALVEKGKSVGPMKVRAEGKAAAVGEVLAEVRQRIVSQNAKDL